MISIRAVFAAFLALAAVNFFWAQVTIESTLMSLGFLGTLPLLSGWGKMFSTSMSLELNSRWSSVALGTVVFLTLFVLVSRLILEPLSHLINVSHVAACLFAIPTLFLLAQRHSREDFLRLWGSFDLVDIFVLLLMGQIFTSYSHTLGGVGHDSTQHIYWVNSIIDSGFSPLNVRGIQLIELYPKSFHVLTRMWGFFVYRQYTSTLMRSIPSVQNLLAFVLIFEFFPRIKKGFLGLSIVFLFFCIFGRPELEKLADGAPRISGLLIFTLGILSAHRFRIHAHLNQLLCATVCGAILLSMSPAYFFSFFSIPVFLWFLKHHASHSVTPVQLRSQQHSSPRFPKMQFLVPVFLLLQDPFYFGYFASFVKGWLPGLISRWSLESWWVFSQMSTAADPIASFKLQFSIESFITWFTQVRLTNRGFYDLFFPHLFGSLSTSGVVISFLVLAFYALRAPRNFLVLVFGLWVSSLCVVAIGSALPSEVNVAAVLKVYSVGTLTFVYSSGFLVLLSLYTLNSWSERFSFFQLDPTPKTPPARIFALILSVALTYGSFFTHLSSRTGAWGKVGLEDLRQLDNLEHFLGNSKTILPCTLPPDSAPEKWMFSRPTSVLMSLGRSPNYYCNFFLGRSATLSYPTVNTDLCTNIRRAVKTLKHLGVEYAVFWSPSEGRRKGASEIPICRNEKTLRDWGFSEKPIRTFGKISVFGVDEKIRALEK